RAELLPTCLPDAEPSTGPSFHHRDVTSALLREDCGSLADAGDAASLDPARARRRARALDQLSHQGHRTARGPDHARDATAQGLRRAVRADRALGVAWRARRRRADHEVPGEPGEGKPPGLGADERRDE